MTLRFASLGSGSKGNGTLVEAGTTCVLVDCGFTVRDTVARLAVLGRRPEHIAAILVTHEHGDHLRGVMPLARRFQLPVWMTAGTARCARLRVTDRVQEIEPDRAFDLGPMQVTPVSVPHDAREPVQYLFDSGRHRLGILTDLGKVTAHVINRYRDCDGLLLEANHDPEMLAQGPYPPPLKRRVGGEWGHLSNCQSAGLLAQINRERLQCLVLGHISQKNNAPAKVAAAVAHLVAGVGKVIYACQDQGFAWQDLS